MPKAPTPNKSAYDGKQTDKQIVKMCPALAEPTLLMGKSKGKTPTMLTTKQSPLTFIITYEHLHMCHV